MTQWFREKKQKTTALSWIFNFYCDLFFNEIVLWHLTKTISKQNSFCLHDLCFWQPRWSRLLDRSHFTEMFIYLHYWKCDSFVDTKRFPLSHLLFMFLCFVFSVFLFEFLQNYWVYSLWCCGAAVCVCSRTHIRLNHQTDFEENIYFWSFKF